jgi:hypothetical protein
MQKALNLISSRAKGKEKEGGEGEKENRRAGFATGLCHLLATWSGKCLSSYEISLITEKVEINNMNSSKNCWKYLIK